LVNSVDPGWVTTDMGGRGGGGVGRRQVEEGAKGIVWAATLPDNGPTEDFSLMISQLHGKVNLKPIVNHTILAPFFFAFYELLYY
jgi:hypothetical protein